MDRPSGVDSSRTTGPIGFIPEPRCHEGNYGLPAQLAGSRVEEVEYAAGRAPDPATRDTATGGGDTGGSDPLTGG